MPPVPVTNLDDDSASVRVSQPQGAVTEAGGQATFTVALGSQPAAPVDVLLTSSRPGEATVTAKLTFGPSDWSAPKLAIVTGVDDAVADGNQLFAIAIALDSDDATYADLVVPDVTLTNADDDSPGLVIGEVDGAPTERGDAATFTIALASRPTAAVQVPLEVSDANEAELGPTAVTFAPDEWASPKTVTVRGVDDDRADGPKTFRVRFGPTTSTDARYQGVTAPSLALANVDDDTPSVQVGAVTGQMREGDATATATFMVRLGSQPTADVRLAIVTGDASEGAPDRDELVFTPVDWDAWQTITMRPVDDALADGDQELLVSLGPAASSDLGYDRLAVAPVRVINRDDDTAGLAIGAVTGQPTEGGATATVGVRLTSRPTGNVVVPLVITDPGEATVSTPQLAFTTTNWSGVQTVTITGVDDALADGTQSFGLAIGPATSTDPSYAGLAVPTLALTNLDDDSAAIRASAASRDVTESGGQATFSVVLASQPSAVVEVPVRITGNEDEAFLNPSRLVFTTASWNAPQVVTLTGVDDLAKDGDQTITVALGPATSADVRYEGLAISPATVSLKNLDNDQAGVIVADFQGAPSESGGRATFTVALRSQPVGAVSIAIAASDASEGSVSPATLAFGASDWATPRLVTVAGVDDLEADGHQPFSVAFDLAGSSDAAYALATVAPIAMLNADDDSAAIVVGLSGGQATEAGGVAAFTVGLTTKPRGNVTIAVTIDDASEGRVDPAIAVPLVFGPDDWAAREVRIAGVDDALVDGDQPFAVRLGPVVAADDPEYAGRTLAAVWLTNRDDDAAGVAIGPVTGQPSEAGGAATFTLTLRTQPSAMVQIPIASSDASEATALPFPVVFTTASWNVPQTVTVTGQQDAIADGDVPFVVRLGPVASADPRYLGLQLPEVRLVNQDDGDRAGLVATAPPILTVAESGTTASFTLKLASEPTSNVVVPLASSDAGEAALSTNALVFTPSSWSVAQSITVRGVDDDLVDGSQPAAIAIGPAVSADPFYAGLALAPLAATNADDDSGALVATVVGVASESGGAAYLSVSLSAAPSDVVTVAISALDATELAAAPPSVAFNAGNWDIAQTIELRGVDDALADGEQTTGVRLVASSADPAFHGDTITVDAKTSDDDQAGVLVGDVGGAPTEQRGAATFALRLTSRPSATVTITATASNGEASIASGAVTTFTTSDWSAPHPIVVRGEDDTIDDGDQRVAVTFAVASSDAAYQGRAVAPVELMNVDDDTRGVIVGAVQGTPSELGAVARFTVRLATQPTATVTIALDSSDTTEGAVASPLVFTTANWSAAQTVTVTGVDDGLQDGDQAYAIRFVSIAGGDYAGLAVADVPMVTRDNDSGASIALRLISGAPTEAGGQALLGVRLASQPAAGVALAIASSKPSEGTVSTTALAFDAQTWSQEKTVIVTGVDDAIDDGDQPFTITFDPATSADAAYRTLPAASVQLVDADDDSAGIRLSAVSGGLTEAGGAATFDVSLTSAPTDTVLVTVVASDAAEAIAAPANLTFGPNDRGPKLVTVTGQDDDRDDGDQPVAIRFAVTSADPLYGGRDVPAVQLLNRDGDDAGVLVSVAGSATSEAANGPTVKVTVRLATRPRHPVTIPVAIGDPSEATADTTAVTLDETNFATGIIVTIAGKDDAIADGAQAFDVLLGPSASNDLLYAGRTVPPIHLVNADDADAIGIVVNKAAVATTESGASDTFTIRLASAPTANVTIPIASSDPREATVTPTVIELGPSNWSTARTVTVTGVNDRVADGARAYRVDLGPTSSADPQYAALAIAPLTGTNADDADAKAVTIGPLTGAVTESGGAASATIVLGSEPTANVRVDATVTTGASEAFVSQGSFVFTPGTWDQPQTLRITGRDDALADGDRAVVVTLTVSSSGDYGALGPFTITTDNRDDDARRVLLGGLQGAATEGGGAATFTVALGSQPSGPVTIAIGDDDVEDLEVNVAPTSLTFTTTSWSTPQTVRVLGRDDAIVDGDRVVTLTLTGDGEYAGVAIAPVTVTNLDNDQPGVAVRLVSGPTTEAGGVASVRVRLATRPVGPVVVRAATSDATEASVSPQTLTFTPATWNVEQTFVVAGVDDDVADRDQGYLLTLVVDPTTTDAAYLGVTLASVPLVNVDDDSAGIVVTAIDVETDELGATGELRVALRSEPTGDVVIALAVDDASEATAAPTELTFTSETWRTPQPVILTGVDDDIVDGHQRYAVVFAPAASSDAGYAGRVAPAITFTNRDAGDAVGLVVAGDDLVTSESGDDAVFQVSLASQPSAPVSVPVTSADASEGFAQPAVLVFTPSNWSATQSVAVVGQNDRGDDGDVGYDVRFGPLASSDAAYAALAQTRRLTNSDDDARGLVLGDLGGGIDEGGARATLTVALASEPTDVVTVTVTATPAAEAAIANGTLTFTPASWSQPQTITISGRDDALADGDQAVRLAFAATGGDYALSATKDGLVNRDDDQVGVVVGAVQGQLTEAGGTASFTLALRSKPTGVVTITTSEASPEATIITGGTLQFTDADWSSPRIVTVRGDDDAGIDDGDEQVTLTFAVASSADAQYALATVPDLTLTNVDDDARGVLVGPVQGAPSELGGVARFTVRLASRPTQPVTIALESGDTSEGTVASPLTFTVDDWSTPQSVAVTGVDDGEQDGDQAFAIRFVSIAGGDYAGLAVPDVLLVNRDNDSGAGLALRVVSGHPTEAGGQALLGVRLTSQPSTTVTIAVASSRPSEGTAPTQPLTFTAQSWSTEQTVLVTGADDAFDDGDQAFAVTFDASGDPAYAALPVASIQLVNVDDDEAGVRVGLVSGQPTEAGGVATFTVALASRPTADVTILVASSDMSAGTASPATLTFKDTDWGARTVTVSATADDRDDGDQPFIVDLGPADSDDARYDGRAIPGVALVAKDDDAAGIDVLVSEPRETSEASADAVVTARVTLRSEPRAPVTIAVAVTDTTEASADRRELVLDAGNWSTGETVTVRGLGDVIADGPQPFELRLGPAASNDPDYAGRPLAPIHLTNLDDGDAIGIVVNKTAVTTSEAGLTDSFTIALASMPTANVTVDVRVSDAGEATVSPQSVTFGPTTWSQPKTITVRGVDDAIDEGAPGAYAITFDVASADEAYDGRPIAPVAGANADDDTRGLVLGAVVGAPDEAGASATFTVALASQPTGVVSVSVIASGNADEVRVAPALIAFTPESWNAPQVVVVTGRDDAEVDGAQDVTLSVAASGADYGGLVQEVALENADDDLKALVIGAVQGTPSEAGGAATFTVALASQPAAGEEVRVSATIAEVDARGEASVTPAELVFTAATWRTPQTIHVAGTADDVDDGDRRFTIALDAGDYGSASVPLVTLDDDSRGVLIGAVQGTPTENGGAATFTVRLASRPTAPVRLTVATASDEALIAPSVVDFDGDDWDALTTVVVTGTDDDDADGNVPFDVTFALAGAGSDYHQLAAGPLGLVNIDDDSAGVTVVLVSGTPTEAGGQATVRVVLNTPPVADVVIPLAVTDPTEGELIAPPVGGQGARELRFTASDWNVAQTVVVEGVNDAIADGDIPFDLVLGPARSADPFYSDLRVAPFRLTNIEDGDRLAIVVTPVTRPLALTEDADAPETRTFQVVLGSEPTADVDIAIASSDPGEAIVSAPTLTFTAESWQTPQVVTVTGVDDHYDDPTQPVTIVLGDAVTRRPETADTSGYRFVTIDPVAVEVHDDLDTAGLVLEAPTPTAFEAGAKATVRVRLTSRPSSTVTIPLSLTQTDALPSAAGTPKLSLDAAALVAHDDATWDAWREVTIAAADDCYDDLDDGNNDAAVAIVAQQPGGYREYASLTAPAVVVSAADADVATLVVDPVAGRTSEHGGSLELTATLGTTPLGEVTITASTQGTPLTSSTLAMLDAGARIGSTCAWSGELTLTGADGGHGPFAVPVAASSTIDSRYAGKTASISVTNLDDDAVAILLSQRGEAREDGITSATLDVRLATPPFDTIAQDGGAVVVKLFIADTAYGGHFIVDGAQSDTTYVTLTADNHETGVPVAVHASDDRRDEASDDAFTVTATVVAQGTTDTTGYTRAGVSAAIELVPVDDDVVGLLVNADATGVESALPAVGEGEWRDVPVRLRTEPTGTVRVRVTVAASARGLRVGNAQGAPVTSTTLELTPSDWSSTDHVVKVHAWDDQVLEPDGQNTFPLELVVLADESDDTTGYDTLPARSVAQPTTDNEPAASISLVQDGGAVVVEGGACVPMIVRASSIPWAFPPDGDASASVTVRVVSSEPEYGGRFLDAQGERVDALDVVLDGASWSGRVVTVCATDDRRNDDDAKFDVTASVTSASDESGLGDVSIGSVRYATADDNDSVGIVVPSLSSIEEGESGQVDITLASQPNGTVVVDLRAHATVRGITLTPSTLTFDAGNWDTAQKLTIGAKQDRIYEPPDARVFEITLEGSDGTTDKTGYATYGRTANQPTGDDEPAPAVTLTREAGASTPTQPTEASDDEDHDDHCVTLTATTSTEPWILDLANDGPGKVVIDLASDDPSYGGGFGAGTNPTDTLTINGGPTWSPSATAVCAKDDARNDDGDTFDVSAAIDAEVIADADTTTDTTGYASATFGTISYTPVDDDAVGVVLVAAEALAEGGDAKNASVRLDSQPDATVVVTVSVDDSVRGLSLGDGSSRSTQLTFTAANWSDPQPIPVSAREDDIAEPAAFLTFPLHATVDAPAETTGYRDLTVPDVGQATIDATSAPQVILERAETPEPTESAGVNHCVDLRVRSASQPWVFGAPEGPGTIALELSSAPVAYGGGFETGDPGTHASSLDAATWKAGRIVSVCATPDDRVDATGFTVSASIDDMTIDHTGYASLTTIAGVTYSPVDDDEERIIVNGGETLAELQEGTAHGVGVRLRSQPEGTVVVAIGVHASPRGLALRTGGDAPARAAALTFDPGNWDDDQLVEVIAKLDAIHEPAGHNEFDVAFSTTPSEYAAPPVDVTQLTTDTDAAPAIVLEPEAVLGVQVQPTESTLDRCVELRLRPNVRPWVLDSNLDLESAGTIELSLSAAPVDRGGSVTSSASLSGSDTTWRDGTIVAVCAIDDDVDDDGSTFVVTPAVTAATASGFTSAAPAAVTYVPIDDDVRGIVITTPDGTSMEEGEEIDVAVTLKSEPSAPLTLAVSIGALRDAAVSPASITIQPADWRSTHVVTITALSDDQVASANATLTLTIGATDADPNSDYGLFDTTAAVTLTVLDQGRCGNDVIEAHEACDGTQIVAGDRCAAHEFGNGTATCTATCTVDRSGCWKATQLAVGARHWCALDEGGHLHCSASAPAQHGLDAAAPATETWLGIASGAYHTCVLGEGGVVTCRGDLDFDNGGEPEAIGLAAMTTIAAGAYDTCGFTQAGTIACHGDLDRDDDGAVEQPPLGVAWDAAEVIGAGPRHACALGDDGAVRCWGDDERGQAPTVWSPMLGTVTAIAAGRHHTCACTEDDVGGTHAECWGDLDLDDSGDDDPAPPNVTCAAIAAGDDFTCVRTEAGAIGCWGRISEATPSGTFSTLSAFGDRACAARSGTGEVVCWGSDKSGYPAVTTRLQADLGFEENRGTLAHTYYGAPNSHACDAVIHGTDASDVWSPVTAMFGAGALVVHAARSQYAEMQCATLVRGQPEVTLDLWFSAASLPAGNGQRTSLAALTDGDTSQELFGLDLVRLPAGVKLRGRARNGTVLAEPTSSVSIEVGRWYHATLVISAQLDRATLYLDGALVAETGWSAASVASSGERLWLGASGVTPSSFFDGTLDAVRVYHLALGPEEVAAAHARSMRVLADECASSPCDTRAVCTNGGVGFSCDCSVAGYDGTGETCTDIDECGGAAPCGQHATCTNTSGSFTCACLVGFERVGEACTDIDECLDANVCPGLHDHCVDDDGGFACVCDAGYEEDAGGCVDVDECTDDPFLCAGSGVHCENLDGAYDCACDDGYVDEAGGCVDVDECTAGPSPCTAAHEVCDNIPGGYECECAEGYEASTDGTCQDVDDCVGVICGPDEHCVDDVAGHACVCDTGYAPDGGGACAPVCESCDDEHEACVAPDQCECESGFTRSAETGACAPEG